MDTTAMLIEYIKAKEKDLDEINGKAERAESYVLGLKAALSILKGGSEKDDEPVYL